MTVRVLLVDDSAVVRRGLANALGRFVGIEVVGTAPDAGVAWRKLEALAPDVMLLDLEMPGTSGLVFLRRVMRARPLPVVVVSGLTPAGSRTALEALEAGAVDVVCKPGPGEPLSAMIATLAGKVRAAAGARPQADPGGTASGARSPLAPPVPHRVGPPAPTGACPIIAMGASTGGTQALRAVLGAMSPDSPPVVIVQHMPASFTASFAERLDAISPLRVRQARHGDTLEPGTALIAPGDRHMLVRGGDLDVRAIELRDGPRVCGHRPSVTALFRSVARVAGAGAVGVLMTGMGADGAEGLEELHRGGATTIAQDEETCVVFGMPKQAIDRGAVDHVEPLHRIAHRVTTAADAILHRQPARSHAGRDGRPTSLAAGRPWTPGAPR